MVVIRLSHGLSLVLRPICSASTGFFGLLFQQLRVLDL
jgi:hypothetical protein